MAALSEFYSCISYLEARLIAGAKSPARFSMLCEAAARLLD